MSANRFMKHLLHGTAEEGIYRHQGNNIAAGVGGYETPAPVNPYAAIAVNTSSTFYAKGRNKYAAGSEGKPGTNEMTSDTVLKVRGLHRVFKNKAAANFAARAIASGK